MTDSLKTISDENLWEVTKGILVEERRLTSSLLDHLREIDRRKLHLKKGYSSLFEFATKELKLSEAEAYRRIQAMRIMGEIPSVQQKLEEGALTMTNLVQAVQFFRAESKVQSQTITIDRRKEILQSLEHKTTREAEKVLRKLAPLAVFDSERVRQITEDKIEIKIVLEKELQEKLDELRLLMSHKKPHMNYTELIEELADLALKKLRVSPLAPRNKRRSASVAPRINGENVGTAPAPTTATAPAPTAAAATKIGRYVSPQLRRTVWQRDQDQCTFVDLTSRRRCQSRFQLEIDHIRPFGKGGVSNLENLRLLCRAHNAWEAIRSYGPNKMALYLPTSPK